MGKRGWKILAGTALVCAGWFLSFTNARAGDQTMQLTKQDDGREISCKLAEQFEVQLESPGGTGYLWEFTDFDTERLEIVAERTVSAADPDRLGAPVARIWTVLARKAGQTGIRLVYRRPWETAAPAETFSVRIQILP